MGDLLIRDLPEGTHEELKRRARSAGMSLQAFVAQLLQRSMAMPTLQEWLADVGGLSRHPDVSGAAAVEEARRQLP